MSPIIGSFSSGSAFGARGGKAVFGGLYDFIDVQFVATKFGSQGPDINQVRTGVSSPSGTDISWVNDTNYLNVSAGIQYWTVPGDGNYQFEAWGGKGRVGNGSTSGYGARMRGDFTLTKGEIIRFVIGQWPQHTGVYGPPAPYGGGGAGGTYVTKSPHNSTASILLVAGGGNGGSYTSSYNGVGASSTAGPAGGTGGGASNQHGGYGGGGFFGNAPQSSPNGYFPKGGFSYINGSEGGAGSVSYGNPGNIAPAAVYGEGGFGGGGGSDHQGGGGGGFNGGGSSNFSSGVGSASTSYNNGTNQVNYSGPTAQAQTGVPTTPSQAVNGGKLVITYIG